MPELTLTQLILVCFIAGSILSLIVYFVYKVFKVSKYRMIVTKIVDHKWYSPQVKYRGQWYYILFDRNYIDGTTPHISLNRVSEFYLEADCLRNLTEFHLYLKDNDVKILNDEHTPEKELTVNQEIRQIILA